MILFFLTLILLNSCKGPEKEKNPSGPMEKLELMDVDRAFSKMSEEKGMKNAFLEYIDSNGVLLSPNSICPLQALMRLITWFARKTIPAIL